MPTDRGGSSREPLLALMDAGATEKEAGAYLDRCFTKARLAVWFRFEVPRCWRRWLNRRNRERSLDWGLFNRLLERNPLPPARVVHSVYARAASP